MFFFQQVCWTNHKEIAGGYPFSDEQIVVIVCVPCENSISNRPNCIAIASLYSGEKALAKLFSSHFHYKKDPRVSNC